MSIIMAAVTGLAVGVGVWFMLSFFTTHLILSIEKKHPALAGTRLLRAAEVTVCGAAVLGSLSFGFWLASVIWLATR